MILKKRSEKEVEFIPIGKGVQAVQGMEFLCIKDVIMQSTRDIAYTKGQVYCSESFGNITDNKGNNNHRAPHDFLAEYFKVKKHKKNKNKENEENH